ncbi:MAG: UvrB/UvrC motif-containing protein [Planctomycetia bacterium]
MQPTICQSCQQNPSTIHYTEIREGSKSELHLCEACAQAQGVTTGPVPAGLPAMLQALAKPASPAGAPAPRCPSCGITFAEFREKGRLGCPQDYEFFREQVDPLLEKIHGRNRHVGRLPRGTDAEASRRADELLRLRRELQQAVQAEQYEAAARLRDRIRQLESLPPGEPVPAAAAAAPARPAPRRRKAGGSSGSGGAGTGGEATPPAGG